MDWRVVMDFFRPSPGNILAAVILFFIIGFLSLATAECTEFYGGGGCLQAGGCGWRCCYSLPLPACEIPEIAVLLLLCAESYLLSCLAFRLHGKLRKRSFH